MTEKYTIRSFALGSVTNKGICQTCSVCLSKSVFNSSLPCSRRLGFSNSSPRAPFPWGCGWLLAMGHSNRALKGSEETGIFLSQLPHYFLPVLLFSQDLLLQAVSFHCHSVVVTASQILRLAKLFIFLINFFFWSLTTFFFFSHLKLQNDKARLIKLRQH